MKHEKQITSLKRIEGQIRGIMRMIEKGEYCVDIITQIQAARGALASVEDKILDRHLHTCFSEAIKCGSDTDREEKINEVLKIIRRSRK